MFYLLDDSFTWWKQWTSRLLRYSCVFGNRSSQGVVPLNTSKWNATRLEVWDKGPLVQNLGKEVNQSCVFSYFFCLISSLRCQCSYLTQHLRNKCPGRWTCKALKCMQSIIAYVVTNPKKEEKGMRFFWSGRIREENKMLLLGDQWLIITCCSHKSRAGD